jgi:hypothetical protein
MALALHQALRKSNKPAPDRKARRKARETLPTRQRTGAAWKEFILTAKELTGWVLLLPLCIVSVVAFSELLFNTARHGQLVSQGEFYPFLLGVVLWGITFTLAHRGLMIAYIYGHEFTHIIAAWMSGAVVYDWHVGPEGGWVDTSKSNTFISLSPYFVPLYTVLVLTLYGLVSLFINLETVQTFHIGQAVIPFSSLKCLCFLIGFTWCFHVTYTVRTMRVEQSDLTRNGTFFSGLLIICCNLYIVAGLLIAASPSLSCADAWQAFYGSGATLFGYTWEVVSTVARGLWDSLADMLGLWQRWRV